MTKRKDAEMQVETERPESERGAEPVKTPRGKIISDWEDEIGQPDRVPEQG